MKVLANETKRILAVLLSVAMIFAYVPNNVMAYADDVSGNDTEEAAVGDAQESPSEQIPEQSEEEEKVTDDSGDALNDLVLDLEAYTTAAGNNWGFTYVNGGTTSTDTAAGVLTAKHEEFFLPDDISPFTSSVGIDSSKDYSFVVSPAYGYAFEGEKDVITAIRYGEYNESSMLRTTKSFAAGTDYTVKDITDSEAKPVLEKFNTGSVLVTIKASALTTVKGKLVYDDAGKAFGREIVVVLGDKTDVATYKGVKVTASGGGKILDGLSESLFDVKTNTQLLVPLSSFLENADKLTLANLNVSVEVKKGDTIIEKLTAPVGTTASLDGTALDDPDWIGIATDRPATGTRGALQINADVLDDLYSLGYTTNVNIDITGAASLNDLLYDYDDELVSVKWVTYDSGAGTYTVAPDSTTLKSAVGNETIYLEVTAADGDTGRTFSPYVLDASGKTYMTEVGGHPGIYSYTIASNSIVCVDTYEKVNVSAGTTGSAKGLVFDATGTVVTDSSTTYAESKEDYEFFVAPASGQAVSSVTYANGAKNATYNDGVYTAKGEDIKNKVVLTPSFATASSSGNAEIKLSGIPTGTKVLPVDITQNDGVGTSLLTTSATTVRANEPYYFIVQGTDTSKPLNKAVIDQVSYTIGTKTVVLDPIAVTPAKTDGASSGDNYDVKYWYVIPSVTGDAQITVQSTAGGGSQVNLTSAVNKNVKMTINDTELTTGASVLATTDAKAEIEVTPAKKGVVIYAVTYSVGSAAAVTLAGDTTYEDSALDVEYGETGQWTIDANILDANTQFNVYTREYVPTDQFKVVFGGAGFDDTAGEGIDKIDGVSKLQTLGADGKHLKNTTVNTDTNGAALKVNAQSLKLAVSTKDVDLDATEFYVYTNNNKTAISKLTTGTLSYDLMNESDIAEVVSATEIHGLEKGTATLVATYTMAMDSATTNSLQYNQVVYAADEDNELDRTAKLPLTVVDRYSNPEVVANSESIYAIPDGTFTVPAGASADYIQSLGILASDNITEKLALLNAATDSDIASIKWSFYPSTTDAGDNVTHKFTTDTGGAITAIDPSEVDAAGGAVTTKYAYGTVYSSSDITIVSNDGTHVDHPSQDGKAYVISKKAEDISVAATLTYADVKDAIGDVTTKGEKVPFEEGKAKAFNSIKDPDKTYFGVLRTDGDIYSYQLAASATAQTMTLGLNTNDPKTFTIHYDVYEVVDNLLDPTSLTTEALLNVAIKNELVEKVTSNVKYSAPVLDRLEDGEFISLSGTGPWTVTAIKDQGATPTLNRIKIGSAFVNGVLVESAANTATFSPRVTSRVSDTSKVNFIAFDKEDKTVTPVTVKSSYYSKFPHSDIEGTNANAGLSKSDPEFNKVIGSSLSSIADGVTIKLPTQADLEGVPAGRTLVGWAEMARFERKAGLAADLTTLATDANGVAGDEYAGAFDPDGGGAAAAGDYVTSSLANYASGTFAGTYNKYVVNPGDYVRVTPAGMGDISYRAIWVDTYQLEGLYNKNLPTLNPDDETVYETEIGDTVEGSKVKAVLAATVVDGTLSIDDWDNSITTLEKVKAALSLDGEDEYIDNYDLKINTKKTTAADGVTITNATSTSCPVINGNKFTGSNSVVLTATYSSGGKNFTIDSEAIKVGKGYALTMELKDSTPATVTKLAVEAGAKATTLTPAIAKDGVAVNIASDAAKYHFDFVSADGTVVKAAENSTNAYQADITGLKESSEAVNVTVTATDINGIQASVVIPVTVTKGDFSIEFVSEPTLKATALESLNARANQTTADVTNNTLIGTATPVYVRTLDKNGKVVTTGTWVIAGDNDVVDSTQTYADEASGSGMKKVLVRTKGVIEDDGTITATYTAAGGRQYETTIPVSTFATIRFKAPYAKSTNVDYVVTKDGVESENRISETDKTSYIDLDLYKKDGTLTKVTKEVKSFDNIDLSKYSMVYKDTSSSPLNKVFKDWNDGTNEFTTDIESLSWTGDFNTVPGMYTLTGELATKVTITGLPNTITLDDTTTNRVVVFDSIKVSPVSSTFGTHQLKFDSDTVNIFKYDGEGANIPATTVNATNNLLGQLADSYKDNTQSYAISFGKILKTATVNPRAGKAILTFYPADGSVLTGQKVTLYVNGLDTVNDVTSYYENGEKVKNAKRTVGSVTYFFDENGAQVTGTKIIELDNKKVLIVGGMVSGPGVSYPSMKYVWRGSAYEDIARHKRNT